MAGLAADVGFLTRSGHLFNYVKLTATLHHDVNPAVAFYPTLTEGTIATDRSLDTRFGNDCSRNCRPSTQIAQCGSQALEGTPRRRRLARRSRGCGDGHPLSSEH